MYNKYMKKIFIPGHLFHDGIGIYVDDQRSSPVDDTHERKIEMNYRVTKTLDALKAEHIRVNDIELANEIILKMNDTAIKADDTIARLRKALEWLAEVHHDATFHNRVDWKTCNAFACERTREALEGKS
jgi:hypothetical protein